MKYTLTIESDSADDIRSVTEKLTARTDTPAAETTPATETPKAEKKETIVPETKSEITGEAQVDSDGMPYDDTIHSTPANTKADGTWKVRKGQAQAAKDARTAFKASGGGVTVPEPTTPKAATGMPGAKVAPGATNIPTDPPVSLDEVMGKAGELLENEDVTAEDLGRFYQETVGTSDPAAAYEAYQTNETGRAALMAKLIEIENAA